MRRHQPPTAKLQRLYMHTGLERVEDRVEIFNIGSEDQIGVKTKANIVIEEMGLEKVRLRFAEGVNGEGVDRRHQEMLFDISRLTSEG